MWQTVPFVTGQDDNLLPRVVNHSLLQSEEG